MFGLTKWYLDVATQDGTVCIVYVARLRWAALHARYAAFLLAVPGKSVLERFTLLSVKPPSRGADGILRWRSPRLSLDGTWRPLRPSVQRRLYECDVGALVWGCVAPRADVRLRVGAHELVGPGYAERLHLTVPPWRLPLDELHWGRFNGVDSSIVWLDWRGDVSRRIVLVDGEDRSAGATVTEHSVTTPDVHLALDTTSSRTLRQGPLLNVLAAVPALRVVPHRFAHAEEHKLVSRATLRSHDGRTDHGWAIHEVVKWGTHERV